MNTSAASSKAYPNQNLNSPDVLSVSEASDAPHSSPSPETGDDELGKMHIWIAITIGLVLRLACRQYIYHDLLSTVAGHENFSTAQYTIVDVATHRTWQDSSLIECAVRVPFTKEYPKSFCPSLSSEYGLKALLYLVASLSPLGMFLASLLLQLAIYRIIHLMHSNASLSTLWFWLCPIVFISSVCSSLQCVFHLVLAAFFYSISNSWKTCSVALLSVLCIFDYEFLTFIPIILLTQHRASVFVAFACFLAGIAFLAYSDSNFIEKISLNSSALENNFYTPSIGVIWYANAQVFDRYSSYFASLWHMQPYLYSLPLGIRLQEHPAEAALLQLSIVLFFRNEFSAGDVAMLTGLYLINWSTLSRVRWIVPIAVTVYGPVLLAPMLMHLWIDRGTGNANYLFFQGFAMCLAIAMFISGFANATLKYRNKKIKSSSIENNMKTDTESERIKTD